LEPGKCISWLSAESVVAFIEPHIEQGRILETSRVRLGVVDAIAGSIRMEFSIVGIAEHSGTTPMELRRDALAAAAEVIVICESVARSRPNTVCTVGRIEVAPNAVTTIPARALFSVDLRSTDGATQKDAALEIERRFDEICGDRQVRGASVVISRHNPVVLSAWPRRALSTAASRLEMPFRILPSGAGHDAAIVARVAPAAMLFIPCEGGRSHVPTELASTDDAAIATEVCVQAMRDLAADVATSYSSQARLEHAN
jgi:allantoate deiminase